MERFTVLTGVAAPLPLVNVDTDMIIPKQFLKTIKRTGLGSALFDEMRYDRSGEEIPGFVLNQPAYREAKILIAGDNFGCGSSREHAPWALLDFGIRCVISTSFADIFYNNCFKNGILPIKVSPEDLEKPEVRKLAYDASVINHLTKDDPPVFMVYSEPDAPLTDDSAPGTGIHHPKFGHILKEKMDALGIEAVYRHTADGQQPVALEHMLSWLQQHLLAPPK